MIKRRLIIGSIALLFFYWMALPMPGVFSLLPVRTQIAIYGMRLRIIPFPSEMARSAIGHGGGIAARALAEDLQRTAPLLPPNETAYILVIIQYRGTPLRGSSADLALQQYLRSGRASKADLIAGTFALDQIRDNVILPASLQPR